MRGCSWPAPPRCSATSPDFVKALNPVQTGVLQKTLAAVRARAAREDEKTFHRLIRLRLERAAAADLN